jgi:hypothetical protein
VGERGGAGMRSNVDETDADLVACFKTLREKFAFADDTPEDVALSGIETFCAIALKVMKKTNPSKIRDCARIVEIKARLDGVEVKEWSRHETH